MEVSTDDSELMIPPKLSFKNELLEALYEARFTAPLFAFFGFLISYYFTIRSYHQNYSPSNFQSSELTSSVPFHLIRPVLNPNEMFMIQNRLLFAETIISTNESSNHHLKSLQVDENVKLRSNYYSTSHGHLPLPNLFYDGVVIGISQENPHNLEYTRHRPSEFNEELLLDAIKSLSPNPTEIFSRKTFFNGTIPNYAKSQFEHFKQTSASSTQSTSENGFAVYYSFSDLKENGLFGIRPAEPWDPLIEQLMLPLARSYRQVYLTIWYPVSFGDPRTAIDPLANQDQQMRYQDRKSQRIEDEKKAIKSRLLLHTSTSYPDNDYRLDEEHGRRALSYQPRSSVPSDLRHFVIIQETIPTRTGLEGLVSKTVVWRAP